MTPVTAGLVFIVNPCLCTHFSVNTLKSNVNNCRGPTSNGLKGFNDNQQPVPSTLAVVFCLPVSSQSAHVIFCHGSPLNFRHMVCLNTNYSRCHVPFLLLLLLFRRLHWTGTQLGDSKQFLTVCPSRQKFIWLTEYNKSYQNGLMSNAFRACLKARLISE